MRGPVWPYAALGAAFLFVNWPVLAKPFFIDNIAPAYCWSLAEGERWSCLWHRSTLPHYFRPLAAPLFGALFSLWGPRAFLFRLLMLCVQAATGACLWGLTRRLCGRSLPGAAAALVYLFSVSHWVELLGTAALPHCLSNLCFWSAVWLCVYGETGPSAIAGFLLAVVGLLFKEHVVMLAGFVWLFRRAAFGPGPWLSGREWGLSLLAAAYVLARLFLLPSSFADRANYWRFGPPGSFSELHLAGVLGMFFEPLRRPLAYPYSLESAAHQFTAAPMAAGAWVIGVLGAGALVFAALGSLDADDARGEAGWRAAAWIGAGGFVLGLLPYAFFRDSLTPDNALHYCLALGAFSIAFGLAVSGKTRGYPGLALKFCLSGLVLRSAFVFRFPPASMPGYRLAAPLEETARTVEFLDREVGAVAQGGRILFEGFPSVLEIPELFQALHPGAEVLDARDPRSAGARFAWRIARREDPDRRVCWTAVPTGGTPRAACWAGPFALTAGLSAP